MDIFEIFAECAIALAGFGAVHAVLQGSTGPRGVVRAWFIVTQGGLAFVLSLLPLLLEHASISHDQLWRIASAFGIACAGAGTISIIAIDIRLARLGHPPQATWILRPVQCMAVIAVLAMLANLIGWPWIPGSLLYAIAIFLIMATGLGALVHSFLVPVQIALSNEQSGQSEKPQATRTGLSE